MAETLLTAARSSRAAAQILALGCLLAAGPAPAQPLEPHGPEIMCLAKGSAIRQYRWVSADGRPQGLPSPAETQAWSEAAQKKLPDAVVQGGQTYRRIGRRRVDLPLRRYFPSVAPVQGLPAVEPLAERRKVLMVLTGPAGCWFDLFQAEGVHDNAAPPQ